MPGCRPRPTTRRPPGPACAPPSAIYLARVDTFEPRGRLTDEELAAEGLAEVRWMTLADLVSLPDEHSGAPVTLRAEWVDLAARLLRDGHPAAPVELGG